MSSLWQDSNGYIIIDIIIVVWIQFSFIGEIRNWTKIAALLLKKYWLTSGHVRAFD